MRVNLVSLLLLSLSATVMAQDALPEDIAALYSKYGGFEYAVEHDAKAGAVTFPPGGKAKNASERVVAHAGSP